MDYDERNNARSMTSDELKVMEYTFDPIRDIKEFHEKYGLDYNGPPRELPTDLREFRVQFMYEELDEYFGDLDADFNEVHPALDKQLDALVDLMYVLLGCAYLHGFDMKEAWRRVHAANMKKVRAARAEDSKRGSTYDVVKPPGWTPPDLSDLVV